MKVKDVKTKILSIKEYLNTIRLSRHEQVCLINLIKHTCS